MVQNQMTKKDLIKEKDQSFGRNSVISNSNRMNAQKTNASSSFDSPNSLKESIYIKEKILPATPTYCTLKKEKGSMVTDDLKSNIATRKQVGDSSENQNESTPDSLKAKKNSKIEAIKRSLLKHASGEYDDSFVSNDDPVFESDELESLTLRTEDAANASKVSDLRRRFEKVESSPKVESEIFSFSSINSDGPKKISMLYPMQSNCESKKDKIDVVNPATKVKSSNEVPVCNNSVKKQGTESPVFSQESKIRSIIDAFNNKKTYVDTSMTNLDKSHENMKVVDNASNSIDSSATKVSTANGTPVKNIAVSLAETAKDPISDSNDVRKTVTNTSVNKEAPFSSPVLKTIDMKVSTAKSSSENSSISTPRIHKVVDGKLDLSKKKQPVDVSCALAQDFSFVANQDASLTSAADICLGNSSDASIVAESDEEIRIRMLKDMIQKTTMQIENGKLDQINDVQSSYKAKTLPVRPLPATKDILGNFKNFENRPVFLDIKDDIQSASSKTDVASLSLITESLADSSILSKIQTSFNPKESSAEFKYSHKLNLYNGQNLLCSAKDLYSRQPIFRAPGPILSCRPTLAYVQSIVTEIGIMIYFKVFCENTLDSWYLLKDPSNTDLLGMMNDDSALNSFIHSNVVTTIHTRTNFLYFENKLVIGRFLGSTLCICQNDICIKIIKCKNVTKSGKDRILVDGTELSLSCESERDAWVNALNNVSSVAKLQVK